MLFATPDLTTRVRIVVHNRNVQSTLRCVICSSEPGWSSSHDEQIVTRLTHQFARPCRVHKASDNCDSAVRRRSSPGTQSKSPCRTMGHAPHLLTNAGMHIYHFSKLPPPPYCPPACRLKRHQLRASRS